jgi:hypothetical protein
MALPVSYKEQDGCWNCAHCHVATSPDTRTYTCLYDFELPPEVADAPTPAQDFKAWEKSMDELIAWECRAARAGRIVQPWGHCEEHSVKEG